MNIRLKMALPVDPKHGLTRGRMCEVIEEHKDRGRRWISRSVLGDTGERIGVFRKEATVISEKEMLEYNQECQADAASF